MGRTLARATRGASLAHVRRVATVPPRAADGLVKDVYRQIEADFGMLAPPVALHAPAPTVLAASWSILRETTLAAGVVSRADKETVAAAVSNANRCPYCVDIHGGTLVGLVRGRADGSAVAADRLDEVADDRVRALARWARESGGAALPRPYPAAHEPELIGVAVTFHYLNRMVNVFLQESPFPPAPGPALGAVRRGASWLLARLASAAVPAGASAGLLPDAPSPPDLSWADGQPHVAAAFARAGAAVDAAGRRAVPTGVRRLVTDALAGASAPPTLDTRAWLDVALATLAAPERPAGRLALLTAMASYRVTDRVVDEVREQGYDDAALIALTSWASLAAARRTGARLHAAAAPAPTS
jgi:alkylhydroperoxidase family enzyme